MKLKFITGLGVVAIAITLFLNTNIQNRNNADLASLIAMNVASAEGDEAIDGDLCSLEQDKWCHVENNGWMHHIYNCEPDKWYTLADCY
ncbi:hypothetical protein JL193_08245 [Polaribacter batillariae]|uniref:NVEALA protein n=1 Tax=Polaribacter batillariae TaxID=2808900 RepID=A0ABX7SYB4_9FLAO|nr:hypothetical protein [Polaribacter batillariae]QTD39212.1 hypothetical protein JL193_08245 [Polaribacter batillariae]